ncbi:MAG: hypothetical protein E7A88_00150 [Dermabacter sp.]|nr:hypothetical protein [Dermabacter sp.]
MNDIRKEDNTLYVSDEYLNSVLNGGNINFIADLHNSNLKSVQKNHGYIANYQIYKQRNKIQNTTSDIVIHFNHIRAHYKQDGIMTVTFAYIIKAILMHYIDTNKTIEINLVKSGEARILKKEVYFKLLPQKPSEKSANRYEVFKPENRIDDINYYNRLIENSKYRIVELPKEALENRDKIYYEEMLLEDLIEVTKREAILLYNKYHNTKPKIQIIEDALDDVNTSTNIENLSDYYMNIENKSEDVLQCLSSLANFRGTCSHLDDEDIDSVFKTFNERKQRVVIIVMIYLLLNTQTSINTISKAANINEEKLMSLKNGEIKIENLNSDTANRLYKYALSTEPIENKSDTFLEKMKRKLKLKNE